MNISDEKLLLETEQYKMERKIEDLVNKNRHLTFIYNAHIRIKNLENENDDLTKNIFLSYNNNLKNVPENLRNYDMCLIAVNREGCQLEHVPENLKDEEMCAEALYNDGCADKWVPKELLELINKKIK